MEQTQLPPILYTRLQLARKAKRKSETVNDILTTTTPDGAAGRWPAWSWETYKQAERDYYKRMDGDTPFDEKDSPIDDPDLERKKLEVDIRWRTEKAKLAEIENKEREGLLIARSDVQDLLSYQSQLFADKIKELCKTDEDYNLIVAELYADLEHYIERKEYSFIGDDEMEMVKDTLDNPNIKQIQKDDPQIYKEVDQLGFSI